MSENTLETLRLQMRISEERLKNAPDPGDIKRPMHSEPSGSGGASQAAPSSQSDIHSSVENSAREWSAYGQMTPGFLTEVVGLIDASLSNISEDILSSATPDLVRHLQGMKKIRMLLARWADSTDGISSVFPDCSFEEMIRAALMARASELRRWGIQTEFEDATTGTTGFGSSPSLYLAVLHVIQCCIDQLRGGAGKLRLAVRLQNSGDRLETSFSFDSVSCPIPENASESLPLGLLHLNNVELRAAQALLNFFGGTLVLENISEPRKAIRIGLSVPANWAGKNIDEGSRI